MLVRRFALPVAALLASACIGDSLVGGNTGPVFLPALETVPYDSLASGKIAFQRFATTAGNFRGVYVIDASVPRTQSLLANRALDRAQLSPNGTLVLYGGVTSNDASLFDVYTSRLADSVETRITTAVANEEGPSWLPDASQIFYKVRGNGKTTLYRQSPTSTASDQVQLVLTDSGGYVWNVDGPVSSNAASRMVFMTFSRGYTITAANIDGTNRVTLRYDTTTSFGPIYQSPTWSPDGTKIAYLQLNFDVTQRVIATTLKTINPDGTGETTIGSVGTIGVLFNATSLSDFSVCWTGPTGSRIVFTALGADGTSHVYAVRPTGGHITPITTNSGVWDRGVSCKH